MFCAVGLGELPGSICEEVGPAQEGVGVEVASEVAGTGDHAAPGEDGFFEFGADLAGGGVASPHGDDGKCEFVEDGYCGFEEGVVVLCGGPDAGYPVVKLRGEGGRGH